MSLRDLQDLISDSVPALTGRVETAAEMSDMIRRQHLPQAPATAFVLPAGLSSRSEGDAGAGSFEQSIDENYAVVLVVRTSGDGSGQKTLPKVETLIWEVVEAVSGQSDPGGDEPDSVGVYRLTRGRLIEVTAGAVFYQLDFAIQRLVLVTG